MTGILGATFKRNPDAATPGRDDPRSRFAALVRTRMDAMRDRPVGDPPDAAWPAEIKAQRQRIAAHNRSTGDRTWARIIIWKGTAPRTDESGRWILTPAMKQCWTDHQRLAEAQEYVTLKGGMTTKR